MRNVVPGVVLEHNILYNTGMKRFIRAVLPAFLLAVSVGQIYAFTNFSDGIASYISTAEHPVTKA